MRVNPREYIIKVVILFLGSILLGYISGVALNIKINKGETTIKISLEEPKLELSESVVPLLDEIDGGKFDLGAFASKGEFYRTDTPEHFIDDTIDHCITEGNYWGAQCVSLAQAFWLSYAGRGLSDCGTGSARGLWECRLQNAGDDFEIITKDQPLQPGDWPIFDSGTWGHVGMVYDYPENNYIPLYGENQGGKHCDEGGSEPNFIKLSDKTLLGSFRPKKYIIPVPEPDVPDSGGI